MFNFKGNEHAAESGIEKLNSVEKNGSKSSIEGAVRGASVKSTAGHGAAVRAVAAGAAAVVLAAGISASGLEGYSSASAQSRLTQLYGSSAYIISESLLSASCVEGDASCETSDEGVLSGLAAEDLTEELSAAAEEMLVQVPHIKGAAAGEKTPEVPEGVELEEGEELPELIDLQLNRLNARLEAYEEEQARLEAQRLRGETIIAAGERYLGTPYLMGGNSPAAFDCSGYVMYILHGLGYPQKGRSAQDVYNITMRISEEELMPGDLVFFKRSTNNFVSHVGFYAGDGKMLHMGTGGCCYTDLTINYWQEWLYGYGRMEWPESDAEEAEKDFE